MLTRKRQKCSVRCLVSSSRGQTSGTTAGRARRGEQRATTVLHTLQQPWPLPQRRRRPSSSKNRCPLHGGINVLRKSVPSIAGLSARYANACDVGNRVPRTITRFAFWISLRTVSSFLSTSVGRTSCICLGSARMRDTHMRSAS